MLARGLPTLTALLFLAGMAGCASAGPDTTDLDRIALMRTEAIYAHLLSDPEVISGGEQDDGFRANTVAARVDPWAGANPPVGPTVAQRKAAVAGLVMGLRGSGWSIISARCVSTETDAVANTEVGTAAGTAASGGYEWEAFGYRMRDAVPYTVHLMAGFAESSGFTVRVAMATPFHADTATYFAAPPAGLPEGTTCIEIHAEQDKANQGTIWSLDGARG